MATRPAVWVLLGTGTGGNAQMVGLAEALGWPYETKHLVYSRYSHCPNLLLGASALGIDRRRSAPLAPPWPDLVIAGSRRSAPLARWIKQRSGGRTRLVHLMHTQAPLAHFDLIITTPQYRLPARDNVLHNSAPLTTIDPARVATATAQWTARVAHLPRPYTALLVGGNSSSYVLDAATAARLGRTASAAVRHSGGALLVTTSARTPADACGALLAAVDCPAFVHRWRPNDPENPYAAFLGLADRFVVTADSASLLADACTTGQPVEIFDWPLRADARRGLKGLVRRWGDARDRQSAPPGSTPTALGRLYDRLVYLGVIKPARDFAAYHRGLQARGLVAGPHPASAPPRQPLDDMQRALERIHQLFPDLAACADRRDPPQPIATPPDLEGAAPSAPEVLDHPRLPG